MNLAEAFFSLSIAGATLPQGTTLKNLSSAVTPWQLLDLSVEHLDTILSRLNEHIAKESRSSFLAGLQEKPTSPNSTSATWKILLEGLIKYKYNEALEVANKAKAAKAKAEMKAELDTLKTLELTTNTEARQTRIKELESYINQ